MLPKGADGIASFINTVMILSFWTDMHGQTVQTQIRLLIRVCIVWTHYSMVETHILNFRVITTNFFGVQIFRKFTVISGVTLLKCMND